MKQTKEYIANYLHCSGVLEEKVADAYASFADQTENPTIKTLLFFIALDSQKHSRILKTLSKNITKTEPTTEECQQILGKTWKTSFMRAQQETLKKQKITSKELASLLDKMINFKSFVGEEYLTTLHLKTLELIAKDKEIDPISLKKILEWIIEDEERHEIIMARIKILITQQNKKRTPNPHRTISSLSRVALRSKSCEMLFQITDAQSTPTANLDKPAKDGARPQTTA
jgi:rubrerythrin